MLSVWQSLGLSCCCKSNYPILFNGCVIFHCMCISCLTFWHWLTPAPSFPGVLSEWPSPSIICSFSLLSNTPLDLLCAMVCLTTHLLKDIWSMQGSHKHSFWEHCWAGFSVSMSLLLWNKYQEEGFGNFWFIHIICSIAQCCLTLCDSMDCSTPGFPVLHQLPEFVQTHVHWVGDVIQPSHPLSPPSPPALSLS